MTLKSQIDWLFVWQKLRYYVQKYVLRKEIERGRYVIASITDPDKIYWKLIDAGYVPNQICYYEPGQRYSVRKTKQHGERKLYQIHVRVFNDEIRAHFEIAYDVGYGGNAEKHYSAVTFQPIPQNYKAELLALIFGIDGQKE